MQMSFRYSMSIDFDSPVCNHNFSLRCIPKSDDRQEITNLKIVIMPEADQWEIEDGFGNLCISGSVKSPHKKFEAVVTGRALMKKQNSVSSENELRENIYKYHTHLTAPSGAVKDAVQKLADRAVKNKAANLKGELKSDTEKLTADIIEIFELEIAETIMDYLHNNMSYVQGVTFVNTTASEAFEMQKGVCQDYSHIMLSMLRTCRICARYVVGMMEGEGFSHAWVEVRHKGRWYGFDPTNYRKTDDRYIKMSHGRDYNDCMINVGCMTGTAMQTTWINVSVAEAVQKKEDNYYDQ